MNNTKNYKMLYEKLKEVNRTNVVHMTELEIENMELKDQLVGQKRRYIMLNEKLELKKILDNMGFSIKYDICVGIAIIILENIERTLFLDDILILEFDDMLKRISYEEIYNSLLETDDSLKEIFKNKCGIEYFLNDYEGGINIDRVMNSMYELCGYCE